MRVTGAAECPSTRGPAEWFTGEVWTDEIALLPDPGLVRALRVHFTPGARTAWHAHPLGQVLHVVEGVGRVQGESGPVRQVRPDHLMCHLAVQERDPTTGQTTIWHERVTDEDYRAAPQPD